MRDGHLTQAEVVQRYLGTIVRPRRTFDALIADERWLMFSLVALSITAAL